MRVRNVLVTIVLVVLSIVMALPVAALSAPDAKMYFAALYDEDDDEADDEMPSVTHPVVLRLAEMMGLEPEEILEVLEEHGVGLGEVKKAFALAQYLGETFGLGWEDLLEAHSAGEGWGLYKSAHRWVQRLGDPTIADEVLERRRSGEGWGQIKKAYGAMPTPTMTITPTVPCTTVTVPAPTVPAKLLKWKMSPGGRAKKTPPGLAKGHVAKPVKAKGKKK